MAELVNGTYAIISVSSSLALTRVSGTSDAINLTESDMNSASNAQVWDVFKSDADIVLDNETKNTWIIKASYGERVLVPTGYVSDQTGIDVIVDDYNTARYDYSDATEDQDSDISVPTYSDAYDTTWAIIDTGSTFTDDDGDTYSVYNIRRVTSTYETEESGESINSLTVSLGVNPPASEDDDPTLITATYDSQAESQQWIFVPTSALYEDGLYTIRAAADPLLGLYVPSSSTANNASIKIGSISTSKNQQFRIEKAGDYYRLVLNHSGKAVDILNNTPKANADVIQYAINQSLFKSSTVQFMSVTKGTAKGAQKAYLEYTVSSSSTDNTYTVKIVKMVFFTTFAKGLSANTKIKARYQSAPGITNTLRAGTFQEKTLKKGAAKNKTTVNFGLKSFTFTYNRGSADIKRTIKMRLSSRPAVYLGVSQTAIANNSRTKKIKVDGKTIAVKKGNLAKYGSKKFEWNGSSWHETNSSSAVEYAKDVSFSITVPATSSGGVDVTDNSQLWAITPVSDKNSIEYEGTVYQKYKIKARSGNFYMDIAGGKAAKDANVQLAAPTTKITQQFILAQTSSPNSDMDEPGTIRETIFSADSDGTNPVEITVTGLTFQSSYEAFQARYLVRSYSDQTNYTDSEWMNVADDSTSNSGMGIPGKPTFEYVPVDGIVRIPFTRTFSLGGDSNARKRELLFDIRGFIEDGDPYPEHGPMRRSTVTIAQNPNMSVRSSSVYADTSSNDIGILTSSVDSLGEGCQILRARLLGGDGVPMSDWVSRSSMRIFHSAIQTLYRFPNNDETIAFEYAMLAMNGAYVSGTANTTFTYTAGSAPTVTYSDDDSERAYVEIDSAAYAFCLYSFTDIDQKRLAIAERIPSQAGRIRWVLVPPLNTEFDIYVMTSSDNTNWTFSYTQGEISSHLFIWNWTSNGSTIKFDDFASIIVNSDNPPQQSRGFATGIQFSKPMARRHPVAFSDISVESNLSVEGTVIDENADYVAAGPLPNHSGPRDLAKLVSLSGLGIHPVYRTPYGDWYTTAIEQVDLSKTELGYSRASVTQKAVKDY